MRAVWTAYLGCCNSGSCATYKTSIEVGVESADSCRALSAECSCDTEVVHSEEKNRGYVKSSDLCEQMKQ